MDLCSRTWGYDVECTEVKMLGLAFLISVVLCIKK